MIAEKKITDVIFDIEMNSAEMICSTQPQTLQMNFRRSFSSPYQTDQGGYMAMLSEKNVYGTINLKTKVEKLRFFINIILLCIYEKSS